MPNGFFSTDGSPRKKKKEKTEGEMEDVQRCARAKVMKRFEAKTHFRV